MDETPMSSRTRVLVMSLSAPIVAFAIVGGLLGKVAAREDTYQHLKMFEDVVELIDKNLKNFIPFKPLGGTAAPGVQPGGAQ